jgi:ankyrin repeat protein
MPARKLPENPSLENLRKIAKTLLKSVRSGSAEFREEVEQFHPRGGEALTDFALNDAQVVIARSYGFGSWPKLKEHLEKLAEFAWDPPGENFDRVESESLFDRFIRLSCLAYDGWWRPSFAENARELLKVHPELARENIYGAATAGDVVAARALLAGDPTIVQRKGGPFGWQPLLYACYSRIKGTEPGHSTLEVARILLEAGADPNAGFLWKGNLPPFTALTGAFGSGEAGGNLPPHQNCQELAQLLLETGADPNDGQTLYNRHFQPGDDHLKLLFAYGLGKDKCGPWYRCFGERLDSPSRIVAEELWSAARKSFLERVKLLVEHGVDVNMPGLRDGRTPYQAAMRAGNRGIAEYLLQHGAKKSELTREEEFAAACISGSRDEALALIRRDPELVQKLGHHGRVELMHRAVEGNRPEGVRLMAELGFEVSAVTRHDGVGINLAATPLHNAAWLGNLEMVKLLMELGADPAVRDPNHRGTPLGWAAYNRQRDVVEYLAQFGTIFDAVQGGNLERVVSLLQEDPSRAKGVDEQGYPLMFYVDPAGKHTEKIIRVLQEFGAQVNMRSKNGRTALDYAKARGNERLANVLREYAANEQDAR